MRSTRSNEALRAPCPDFTHCGVHRGGGEAARPFWFQTAFCCAAFLIVLSGCGQVQVTSIGTSLTQSVPDPQLPVVNGTPPTSVQAGVLYDYVPNVSDALSSTLTFEISNMPAWATFNTWTGELKGTPALDDVGITA
jgi:hypothetical protein